MTVDMTASFSERRKMMRYVWTSLVSSPLPIFDVAVKKRAILSKVKLKSVSVNA